MAQIYDFFIVYQANIMLKNNATNRYGISQAITLKVWPLLSPLFRAGLRKYRGIPVKVLGEAIATNIFKEGKKYEVLQWDDFYSILRE